LKLLTQKKIVQSREKDLFFFRSVILNVSMNYGSKGLLDTGFIKTFKNHNFKKKSFFSKLEKKKCFFFLNKG